MQVASYKNNYQLNAAQDAVVTAPRGHQLVLAGAGSGKTRVLVHRIAWLMQTEQINPQHIFAVTFTNKAAQEMLTRIEQILGWSASKMWIGTFHGLAHRLLRMHASDTNLEDNFQILDSDDQTRLIRRLLKTLEMAESKWPIRVVAHFINSQKDEGKRVKHLPAPQTEYDRKLHRLYQEYEEHCFKTHSVDFAELLLRSYELLHDNADLREHYQARFREILVDEFQDTNSIQYAWLKLLVNDQNYLTVVGDDDQSIYSWRGARVSHIARFCDDFPNVTVQRLEQNYRSTETILAAANALIVHNQSRMGKKLWTEGNVGEPITLYTAFNEIEEANFVLASIQKALEQGSKRRECAILYRSNAQSRVLEEALLHAGIPYRVYGGLRFFERAEIKDAMCYLRLVANRFDDAAFERIINQPARGIGERTISALRDFARAQGCSLWQATTQLLGSQAFPKRTHAALVYFVQLIDELADLTAEYDLAKQTQIIIERSGLKEFYKQEEGERAQTRLENLGELITAAAQFDNTQVLQGLTPLSAFIAQSVLDAGEEFRHSDADCVQLMTLHSAKGLEFPNVFLCGLEEGLFPHHLSQQSTAQLEEERRLCYVGMTRAKQKLFLSYAEKRTLHGKESYHTSSRFIYEIPSELIDEVRRNTMVRKAFTGSAPERRATYAQFQKPIVQYALGETVYHPVLGEGVVLSYEGSGAQTRILVQFVEHGEKWLLALYAKLSR